MKRYLVLGLVAALATPGHATGPKEAAPQQTPSSVSEVRAMYADQSGRCAEGDRGGEVKSIDVTDAAGLRRSLAIKDENFSPPPGKYLLVKYALDDIGTSAIFGPIEKSAKKADFSSLIGTPACLGGIKRARDEYAAKIAAGESMPAPKMIPAEQRN